jgi:hypothetical protein
MMSESQPNPKKNERPNLVIIGITVATGLTILLLRMLWFK